MNLLKDLAGQSSKRKRAIQALERDTAALITPVTSFPSQCQTSGMATGMTTAAGKEFQAYRDWFQVKQVGIGTMFRLSLYIMIPATGGDQIPLNFLAE